MPRSTEHSGTADRDNDPPPPDKRNTDTGGAGQWTKNSARDAAHKDDD